METPLSGSHLGPHCTPFTRLSATRPSSEKQSVPRSCPSRRLLFLQPQFTTETFDDEYKDGLPKRGSPYNGLGLNTVLLEEHATRIRRRPRRRWPDPRPSDAWPCSQGNWREVGRHPPRCAAVVWSVLRVSSLDHSRRSLVQRSRRAQSCAGCQQLTEPPQSASGTLWGERPRSGAVCVAAAPRVP